MFAEPDHFSHLFFFSWSWAGGEYQVHSAWLVLNRSYNCSRLACPLPFLKQALNEKSSQCDGVRCDWWGKRLIPNLVWFFVTGGLLPISVGGSLIMCLSKCIILPDGLGLSDPILVCVCRWCLGCGIDSWGIEGNCKRINDGYGKFSF